MEGPRNKAIGRRAVLTWTAAAAAALAGLPAGPAVPATRRAATYLVPGYRTDVAAYRGRTVSESAELRRDFPADYQGFGTLVTRIAERDGTVRRALLPIEGHAITVAPQGDRAVWNSMNGESLLSFDPESLALESFARPRGEDFIGGGHAIYTADGRQALFVERRRYGSRPARPEQQYGQVTIRDPQSLAVLETYSSQGVAPHQIVLLADGRHLAISHYGSDNLPAPGEPLHILEPSLVILELASGRLVEKWVGPDLHYEVRHLAAHGLDRIAAILIRKVPAASAPPLGRPGDEVYEPDLSVEPGDAYLPAPVQFYDTARPERPTATTLPAEPMDARQGQSIVYDPQHDEMIVTFASSHRVIVFAGATGAIRAIVRTDRLGLRYPRGLVLHPDGDHYAVSGSWQGVRLFKRGSHEPVPERDLHTLFFDHSHLAVV